MSPTLACHLDADLQKRLDKLLTPQGREPYHWQVPISRNDLRRLMAAAGMSVPPGADDLPLLRDVLPPIA